MSNPDKLHKAWMVLFGLCFICILSSIILPSGNAYSVEQVREIKSDNNVKNIVWMVLKYEKANGGKMPATMKDVAGYSDGMFDYFYPPIPTFPTPIDSMTNIDVINTHTTYCLVYKQSANIPTRAIHANRYSVHEYVLVHPPNTKILVYEKPGLWSDGTIEHL
jgi:hypothetical protein